MIAGLVSSLSPDLSAVIIVAREIAWKAAILCLAAGIAHLLAGRRRVLVRSAVWHACLVGLVLLPVIVAYCPRMAVAVLDSQSAPQALPRFAPAVESPAIAVDAERPVTASEWGQSSERQPSAVPVTARSVEPATDTTETTPAAGMITVNLQNAAITLAVVIYSLVVVVLLARLAASLRSVSTLRRSATPVSGLAWLSAFGHWCSNLGVRAPVALRQSESVSVPVVIGWLRPVILLPVELAQTGDRPVIDAVLLHELTHVARGDYAWNLLLRVVQAVYWPHPLVWLVGRMVRQVREAACDAVCVHWMQDVRAYCGILVDVAAGLAERSTIILGMAISHSSRLSLRLARIECSPGLVQGVLNRRARAALALAVCGAVGVLGAAQLVPRASAAVQNLPDPLSSAQSDDGNREPPRASVPKDRLALDEHSSDGSSQAEPPADEKTNNPERISVKSSFWIDPQNQNQYFVAVQYGDESKRVPITTVKVKRGKLERTTTQAASLEAYGQISIHARNAGIISKALVDVGDRVKAGQVLAELDVPDIGSEIAEKEAVLAQAEAAEEQARALVEAAEAALTAYEANVEAAKAESARAASYEKFRKVQYDRLKKLFETKSIEERLLDEKEEEYAAAAAEAKSAVAKVHTTAADGAKGISDVRAAKAGLKAATLRTAAAKSSVGRSQYKTLDAVRLIRSPIEGVVLERNVEADLSVKPGDAKPLFRIASTGLITAVVQVPERDAVKVKRDNPATVEFDSLPQLGAVVGKVGRVAYSIDPKTRTARTEIVVPNPEGQLKPGMFGRARIVVREVPDALTVPASAMRYRVVDNKKEVLLCFRVLDGRVVQTPVKTGYSNGDQTQVLEGLKEGDEVVAALPAEIQDGQPVELIPPEKK